MNIAITHLAFNTQSNLISFIESGKIDNLELVFSKIEDEDALIDSLNSNGIKTKTTQSILFGSTIQDFLDDEMIHHMKSLSKKCIKFGITTLVLGSPKQRNVNDRARLISQFQQIDSIMRSSNQILCIEPNCKKYGGSYFFSVREIVEFIKEGNFTNIKTMIDTHNIINENESPSDDLRNHSEYIFHIHISENDLKPFVNSEQHENLSKVIKDCNYNKTITYEVLPCENLVESFNQILKTYK